MRARAVVALVTLMVMASCTEATGPNLSNIPGYLISAVHVRPSIDTIFVPPVIRPTDRVAFRATARGKNGDILPSMTFFWSSSDESVAIVDENGVVTPRSMGVVEISASADKIGTATLVILPATILVSITPAVDTIQVSLPIVGTRDTVRLAAAATDLSGSPLPGLSFDWSSSVPSVATVDANGLVRAVSLGTTTISVSTGGHSAAATVHVVAVVPSS